ncbi:MULTISPECIES: YihY/virulence factor BrkB family protein [unclassified Microbacterium]|uniref:YihY/virulence factor BrkB family protein n=1 Tax=unclassified Microbacterium TaxID=2609290 RepID=UPI00214B6769|nr:MULTISPECIES: YihY/virulence factor BrkB family protein [unclassified Microbacterium]MCR2783548.1 YihY/virulence factor BrkB family protein [Microbacterium sp. zg.B96]MDL5351680.1 YihY/virulence factor BrkB family protein [Microbacterium sp. zg-YB36]WIM15591.1 YihY/virulence factor BrkB family protein [Microbacterium sp. zg-B96]
MNQQNQDTRGGAVHPDHADKPDAPTQIEKRSWKYVLVKTVREFTADGCVDAAAGLTYYAVLSIFPALIAVFSLLGVFGQSGSAADAVLGIVEDVAPGETAETLRGPIEQLSQAPGAGFALITGILLALWTASGYVGAFSRAMNRIYEVEEGRPFWKMRPMQLVVTIIAVVCLTIVAAGLVLSGGVADAVGSAIGVGEGVRIAWDIVKWPLLLLVVVFLIAVLYYATPNAKQPKFRWVSMGALLAIVVLALGTLGFGLYVANFSNYDRTYGSLAGVIVFLLWLWIANLALLFGAEFDAELERGRQLQGGIAAEEDIQLPARDTRQSDKRAEKEREDIAEGRRIRQQHADDS